jgi:hypothetical protein
MDGTILGQGSFLASSTNLSNPNAGNASRGQANQTIIQIPSGADWLSVRNYTQYGTVGANGGAYFNGTANANVGIEFFWQRGMAAGTGIVNAYKASASAVLSGDTLVSGGFTLYDPSGQDSGAQPVLGNPVATTASTNATRPVVSTGNTAGVIVGSIVRLSNTAQTDVNGIDMVVSAVTANTSFTLLAASNALATAPGAIGGAGFYRLVNFDPLFYPRRRYITKITQAANAQVSVSVPHNYAVGQAVRFNIPAVSGMVQLNPSAANNYLVGNIVSIVDAYNFTVDINSSAFTAFTWPTIAQQPSSFPEVTPVGEDSALSLSSSAAQVPLDQWGVPVYNANNGLLSDATVNTGYLGMILGAGGNGLELTTPILGPAGSISWSAGDVPTSDVLYWVAGKSTYGGL